MSPTEAAIRIVEQAECAAQKELGDAALWQALVDQIKQDATKPLASRDADLAALRKERDEWEDRAKTAENKIDFEVSDYQRCNEKRIEFLSRAMSAEADLTTTRALLARCVEALERLRNFCGGWEMETSPRLRIVIPWRERGPMYQWKEAMVQAGDTLVAVRAAQEKKGGEDE